MGANESWPVRARRPHDSRRDAGATVPHIRSPSRRRENVARGEALGESANVTKP